MNSKFSKFSESSGARPGLRAPQPESAHLLALTGTLLRAPEQLTHSEAGDGQRLAELAPRLLAIGVVGMALFGLVLGCYRGEAQYLYAALKTPALFLIPILFGLPAIRAVHGACELQLSWSQLALAALVALARTAVLAAACGPVLWLYLSLTPDYHRAVLAMAASFALIGLPGLWTLTRCVPAGGRQRPLATAASVAVLGALLAQSGWLLRPFIARPKAEVTFLRPVEADVFSSLRSTGSAAQGNYDNWTASGAGLLGRRSSSAQPEIDP